MLQFMRVVASHGSIVCRAVLLDLANLMETSGHQVFNLVLPTSLTCLMF